MGRGRTTDTEGLPEADTRFRLVAESHRALAQRLESFVNEMPLACMIWDQDARVIEWNPAAARMFGWSEAEAFQQGYTDLLAPHEDRDANERLWKDLLAGTTAHRQSGARTKSRGVIECEWFHAPLLDPSGRTVGVASIVQDLTERKALERQLLQSQKLEAVAVLAGGIAHDFNNLLTSVLGNISLALMKLGPRHPAAAGLKDAERAAERAADLTKQLLRFSRKKTAELAVVDLNQSVREVISLLKHSVEPAVTIETSLAADLWRIEADPGQLAQVVMNLCVNAWDAVGAKGHIRLATANRQLRRRAGRGHPEARSGDFVELLVSDDGSGMDEATQLHLFEPFFTTKQPGKGTGLGLAMVYSILKQHRGWVAVTSRRGQGSTFRVYLPRTERHLAKETAGRETAARPGSGTILLADDEDGVRKLTAAVLEHNGHRVIQAKDGEEALGVFRRSRKRVRLVVLDLKMPKMSGWETLERIRALDPQVPVILISGCALEEEHGKALDLGAHTLLAKPYRAQALLTAVDEGLQAERGHGKDWEGLKSGRAAL
jgi:two-component system, cell cycle sensor histidine kinase and response regulator CckA